MLSSCCKKQEYNTEILPLHRLNKVEVPMCKKEKYRDLVNCLFSYKKALDQNNDDKEKITQLLSE